MEAFLGLDVGTQGARAVVCAVPEKEGETGRVVARAALPFPEGTVPVGLPPGHAEQSPAGWWDAAAGCLREVSASVPPGSIRALGVTSTSGTVCLLDAEGVPLAAALMYNDSRAVEEAFVVQEVGAELSARLGYRFNTSFALSKLLWLARHRPELVEAARYFAHAADFITGRLCGSFDVTDYSNALKTGYDLLEDRWPGFISDELGLPVEKLPRVVAPGEAVGTVTRWAAEATGLRPGTPVVAGMTDGCAGQVAAGAVTPGDWSTTLGTTLVLKGVTSSLLLDPAGRVYSHRHPDGYWLPGGASNTGGEVLAARFEGADLAALDARAAELSPTDFIAYPLARRGERFPFVRPDAEGFFLPTEEGVDDETVYAACLEGVAYVERLSYETLESLGAEVGGAIRAVGGGARSDAWLQIRADVLNRELSRPVETGAAMGAAILAAGQVLYGGVVPAARALVQVDRVVRPRPSMVELYDERYQRFRAACVGRGYIDD